MTAKKGGRMADLVDKAILVGKELEKRLKELMEELEKRGSEAMKADATEAGGARPLTPRQALENKVVQEGVKALKELLNAIKTAKEKVEGEVAGGAGRVLKGLDVPTREDIEVIKEMARVAREKVDALEKRVEALEESSGAK
jgi:BMFP domain-containing protein YqiC